MTLSSKMMGQRAMTKMRWSDLWNDEEELYFAGIPEAPWHDGDLKVTPDPPEEWIELLADQVEISRLLDMKLLVRKEEFGPRWVKLEAQSRF